MHKHGTSAFGFLDFMDFLVEGFIYILEVHIQTKTNANNTFLQVQQYLYLYHWNHCVHIRDSRCVASNGNTKCIFACLASALGRVSK